MVYLCKLKKLHFSRLNYLNLFFNLKNVLFIALKQYKEHESIINPVDVIYYNAVLVIDCNDPA